MTLSIKANDLKLMSILIFFSKALNEIHFKYFFVIESIEKLSIQIDIVHSNFSSFKCPNNCQQTRSQLILKVPRQLLNYSKKNFSHSDMKRFAFQSNCVCRFHKCTKYNFLLAMHEKENRMVTKKKSNK